VIAHDRHDVYGIVFRDVGYTIPKKWYEMICEYNIAQVLAGIQKFEYVGAICNFEKID
jgi:hypothetical protein